MYSSSHFSKILQKNVMKGSFNPNFAKLKKISEIFDKNNVMKRFLWFLNIIKIIS